MLYLFGQDAKLIQVQFNNYHGLQFKGISLLTSIEVKRISGYESSLTFEIKRNPDTVDDKENDCKTMLNAIVVPKEFVLHVEYK